MKAYSIINNTENDYLLPLLAHEEQLRDVNRIVDGKIITFTEDVVVPTVHDQVWVPPTLMSDGITGKTTVSEEELKSLKDNPATAFYFEKNWLMAIPVDIEGDTIVRAAPELTDKGEI